jgi:hypothetical protein
MLAGDVKLQTPIYFKVYSRPNYGFWVFTLRSLVGGFFPVVSEQHAASVFMVNEFGSGGSRTSVSI